ncbi:hypothetical protein B566_EDAN001536 [Ephemera danica]|nr:hypothetical protein B566_EDAN001536 [Ephemera danica]
MGMLDIRLVLPHVDEVVTQLSELDQPQHELVVTLPHPRVEISPLTGECSQPPVPVDNSQPPVPDSSISARSKWCRGSEDRVKDQNIMASLLSSPHGTGLARQHPSIISSGR